MKNCENYFPQIAFYSQKLHINIFTKLSHLPQKFYLSLVYLEILLIFNPSVVEELLYFFWLSSSENNLTH